LPLRAAAFDATALGSAKGTTLRRGYSITMSERGKIIRTIAAIRPKMKIRTQIGDDEFGSEIPSQTPQLRHGDKTPI
jgi:exonuclease VII large subunit